MKTFAALWRLVGRTASITVIAPIGVACFMGFVAFESKADVLNWPTNGWIELYGQESLFSDIPNDTGNNGHEYLDIVGDTNYAGAFFHYRTASESGELEDQMLFRVRLDSKKNKMPGAFQIFFEIDHDTSVDWVMQLSTDDLDSGAEVSFGEASGTNRTAITFGSITWTNTNGYYNWTGIATDDGSMFNTDEDYFIDFGMPWPVFTNYTGIASTNDPFRFVITTSQSGGQVDDGDVGNSSAGLGVDIGFGDIFIDPDPEPGTYPQLIHFPHPGHQYLTNSTKLTANAESGLPVEISLISGPAVLSAQSNLTFNGTGTVTVVATQGGDYTWKAAQAVTNIITVGKVPTAITLGDLNPVYDGTEKPVSIATDPTGVVANVMYDGSIDAPTDAGTYTVVVSIDDPVYGGTQTNTLTIAKADQSIDVPNPGPQHLTNTVVLSAFADSGLPVSFSVGSGPAELSGSTLTFTNSGTVVIFADQAGDTNWNAAVQTNIMFEVNNKAHASILLSGLSVTYDGTAKSVSSETTPSGPTLDITYDGSPNAPTNAGTYNVAAVINDAAYQGMTNAVFTIHKAAQVMTFNPIADQVVTNTVNLNASTTGVGTPAFEVISGPAIYNPSGPSLSFSGTGTVSVAAFETNSVNYAPVYVTNTFSVTQSVPGITATNLMQVYGSITPVGAITQPGGLPYDVTYDGLAAVPTNAGTYEVIITVETPVYKGAVTNTLTISAADQVLTFDPIGDQVTTNVVSLSAGTTGDGTPEFEVISGPAIYNPSGPSLSFSATGIVTVVAFETNSVNYAPVYVTNIFEVTHGIVADLSIMLIGPTNGIVGVPLTFELHVENHGPSAASNIVVQKQLPTNQVFRAIVHSGSLTNHVINWSAIAGLGAGEQTNFVITAEPENPGIFYHAASVLSSTYDPDPSNNSSTGGLSQVAVEIVAAAYGLFDMPIALNLQTGLFEQHLTVTNTMTVAAPAFRLEVDGLRSGVTLWNATGITNGVPYVQMDTPLNPGESVSLILEFFVPDFLSFTNSLTVVWTLPENPPPVAMGGLNIDTSFWDNSRAPGRFVIEFESDVGAVYTILYSDDLSSWHAARPPVVAGGTRTQWYDDGPPKTRSHPGSSTNRFYKVIED